MTDDLKNLGENHKTPDKVEDEIFNTLDSMKLFMDIADLFTLKYAKANGEMLGLSSDDEEDENEESKK